MDKKIEVYCCNEFKELATKGPNKGAEQDDEDKTLWHVNRCCGGGCYVVTDMKYCPFCGQRFKGSDNGFESEA